VQAPAVGGAVASWAVGLQAEEGAVGEDVGDACGGHQGSKEERDGFAVGWEVGRDARCVTGWERCVRRYAKWVKVGTGMR
jgi:hypothetical protein